MTQLHVVARSCLSTWQHADGYFFKNMARLRHLYELASSFHSDLTLREVGASRRIDLFLGVHAMGECLCAVGLHGIESQAHKPIMCPVAMLAC